QVDEFAIAPHVSHRESAHVRAIHIKLYATCQMRKIFFLQARYCALVACYRARIAGVDARSHLFIHDVSWTILCRGVRVGLSVTVRIWRSSGAGSDRSPDNFVAMPPTAALKCGSE